MEQNAAELLYTSDTYSLGYFVFTAHVHQKTVCSKTVVPKMISFLFVSEDAVL